MARGFLWSYLKSKINVLGEVQNPRAQFFNYEIKYTLSNVLRTFRKSSKWVPTWNGPEVVDTKFGKFIVRQGTQDPAMISPAFERRDFDKLLAVVKEKTDAGKSVLFVDIGANIGKFSISVLKEFRNKPVFALAFEPVPEHVKMLNKSRELNGIPADRLNIQQLALHKNPGKMAMSLDLKSFGNSKLGGEVAYQHQQINVDVVRLDHFPWQRLVPSLGFKPVLVCKMDVEGSELPILESGLGFFEAFEDVTLMIEDTFNSKELHEQLTKMQFVLQDKLTPYNSWWTRAGRP